MTTQKKKLDCGASSSAPKQWKETPPGQEQKFLENLFINNEIEESDTPVMVKNKHPIFHGFSAKIFGTHFRKTRAKFGFGCKYFINIF